MFLLNQEPGTDYSVLFTGGDSAGAQDSAGGQEAFSMNI